ncbi:MAG: amidase [Alphaproteobacteria bacterium]|jgi:aspartyl-tRNA(Asn)/glutamyl-tRNA(Gln) amidotransferase subunit A|nr:amidase [Alphaproteobacteria bacterium]
MTDPTRLTIEAASAAMAAGELDPVALCEAYLARIEARDRALNCYITLTADMARQAADDSATRARAGARLGPLDGIPIALKDNIDVAGVATSNGCGPEAAVTPDEDAEVVRRLRAAGAVLLGKLNMHEGALGATTDNAHHGKTENPWRLGYTPGGSSGGSGAAVAARLSAAALGTDTMGSVRLPAAYCGVVGLKPSFGLVGQRGLHLLCQELDCIGPLTRGVGDAALMLAAMAGYDPDDPTSLAAADAVAIDVGNTGLAGLKIGVLENYAEVETEADVAAGFERALELIRAAGAEIVSLALADYAPTRARRAGLLVTEAEGWVIHEVGLVERPQAYSPEFRGMLEFGRDIGAARLVKAQATVRRLGFEVRRLLRDVDLIASPTTPQTAFPFTESAPANQADYSALANFAGAPAISLPMGLSANGLPTGLQLAGRPLGETVLLGAATTLARLLPNPNLSDT